MNKIQALFELMRSRGVDIQESAAATGTSSGRYALIKAHDLGVFFGLSNAAAYFRTLAAKEGNLGLIEMKPPGQGRGRTVMYIAEPLFYLFLFESQTPIAQEFKAWITGTVLNRISNDGLYTNQMESNNV